MRTLSPTELSALTSHASILEQDGLGAKVLKLEDGSLLKLFRKRPVFSSETLKPYAKRFAQNAVRLRHLGFNSPQIIQIYWLVDPINKTAVHYWPLPGQTLRHALASSTIEQRQQLVEKFGALLARLHTCGVYFRSVHLGNVLVQPDGQLGLIDLADMRISRFSLSLSKRRRNLKHMRRYAEDQRWLFDEHLEALKTGYNRATDNQTLKLFE